MSRERRIAPFGGASLTKIAPEWRSVAAQTSLRRYDFPRRTFDSWRSPGAYLELTGLLAHSDITEIVRDSDFEIEKHSFVLQHLAQC